MEQEQDDAGLRVKNEELRTVREAVREMLAILGLLDGGALKKVVLTSGGRMRAVILSVREYQRLSGDREDPA